MKTTLVSAFLLSLTAITQATTFTYDDAGQLIAESYPNGAHAFYEYDNIGNPIRRTTIAPNSEPQSNLTITSNVSPSPATAGTPVTVTFTITNNGPDPATEVTLNDVFPAEFTPTSADATQGNCELDGQSLDCLLGTLANGQAVNVTVEGIAAANGTLTTTSTVTSPEETDASDNETTINTPIDGGIDLAFSFFQQGPSPATNTGSTLIFFVNAINNGPTDATNVTQTFNLPPELTFLFATGESVNNAGVVTTDLGTLAPGDEITTIIFANPTGAIGIFTTTANIAADQTDTDPSNNLAQFDSEILGTTLTVTNTNDSGPGSLRQAIVDANADPDADVIGFNLPDSTVQTITPLNDLPNITEPVIIDGFSAAAGLVEINGTNLTNGFTIESSDVCLRALVINRCGDSGIRARGTNGNRLTGISVEGCLIGINANGDTALPNGDHGIDFDEVDDSSIGGSEFWMANTISGNGNHGILIRSDCNDITIAGNHIGTDLLAELDLGNSDNGILFLGTNSLIGGTGSTDGNIISGNDDFGIDLAGEGNLVLQNYIGTNFNGLDAIPNGTANNTRSGIIAGSFNEDNPNIIGGPTESERNLISGNAGRNVRLLRGALCIGNFIGPNITGNALLNNPPSFTHGVELNNGATLGGILPNEGNVISGNTFSGILLDDFLPGETFILGNKIGLAFDGNNGLGNNDSGIVINNEGGTKHIGLDIAGAGNIISGNSDEGIISIDVFGGPTPANILIKGNKIGTNTEGSAAVPNGDGGITIFDGTNITIGSAVHIGGNLISGNLDAGIGAFSGVTDLHIEGNLIGTDASGTFEIGNLEEGISSSADNVQIINNLVSGNGDPSASFSSREEGIFSNGDNVVIQGNRVGTDQSGSFAIPNASGGILVSGGGGDNILVGGASAGQGNLISGNEFPNLQVNTDATIAGNIIGPDSTGDAPLTGSPNAVGAQLSSSNGIFGLPGKHGGNLVSANGNDGIRLSGDNWTLQNNRIGTTTDGLSALSNYGAGIAISSGADRGLIVDNLISGNLGDGILLDGEDLNIQRNAIGLNSEEAPLGNGGNGVKSTTIFGINLLGGTNPDDGNTIAHNALAGVRNEGDGASGGADLTILGNSIFANGILGIDLTNSNGLLDGITPNDTDDLDEGSNDLQNFPLIVTAGTSITGTLNSAPKQNYRIEFFANNVADPSGNGEGEIFLGFLNTTTDINGDAAFTFKPTSPPTAGQFITATATNGANQTSEFGPGISIAGGGGFEDTDNDGISDEYELEHFGSITGGAPNEDPDGDGQNNLAEFLALTDPNDATSFLTIDIRIDENGNVVLSLTTETGRTYQLHADDDDLDDFQPLGAPVVGDGNILEFIDPVGTRPRRFYRITVSQ